MITSLFFLLHFRVCIHTNKNAHIIIIIIVDLVNLVTLGTVQLGRNSKVAAFKKLPQLKNDLTSNLMTNFAVLSWDNEG